MTDRRMRLALGLLLLACLGSSCSKSSSPTSNNQIPGVHFAVVDSLQLATGTWPPVEYGTYLFLGGSDPGGMFIINRMHPMSVLARSTAVAAPLTVYNGALYGVTFISGTLKYELRSCSLATPTSPQVLGSYTYDVSSNNWNGFYPPKGPTAGYLYGMVGGMLRTLNVTDPAAMFIVDSTQSIRSTNSEGQPVMQDSSLAVLYQYDSAVILDVTNPAHPVRTGRILPVGEFRDASFHGGTLYLNEGWKGVYIFDRSNLTTPLAVIPSARDSVTRILFRRDTLFIRDGGFIQAYDVSSPAAPKKLAEIDLHGEVWGFSGSDDLYAGVERGTSTFLLALRLVTK